MTNQANDAALEPAFPGRDTELHANAVLFGRLLRRAGLAVDPAQTRLFLRTMMLLGLSRKADIKAAGRAIYVRRCEDRAIYDVAFELFWRRRGEPMSRPAPTPTPSGQRPESGTRGRPSTTPAGTTSRS